MLRTFLVLVLVPLFSACGSPLAIKTPSGFADVTERAGGGYAYRATSADGVVLAVRTIERDPPDAEASFWHQAIENQLRQRGGYARLSAAPVKTDAGAEGLQLVFGHDQNGKPYLYQVSIFLTPAWIVLAEAGGRKERVEAQHDVLSRALRSLSLPQ